MVVYEPKNKGKGDLAQQTTLLSCPSAVSSHLSQRSQEILQPYHDCFNLKLQERTNVGKFLKSRYEDYLEQSSNVLDGLEMNMYSYEDLISAFLRSDGGLMLCHFIKIQSIYIFSCELPFSSFPFFLMSKHLRRIQLVEKMLTLFYWLFHFTLLGDV